MARIGNLRLFRARLSGWGRPPRLLLLFLLGDLLELAGSIALAALSPPPPASRLPYVAFDVPVTAPVPTLGVAALGAMLGLLMGASLVAELVLLFRRAQVLRWRDRRLVTRGRARSRATVGTTA